ncbi:hypothetical protein Ahy_A01g003412 [Arachis hypogaea]|uniref:SWIM-type domain-containing protein n=1 Tax=Arachis hypogaea TaxID=3818 RepID=A0A445ESX7_ARAHY|nr:hypothetical protein Ahy_A01g003412 [Arachis hypogaea]
MPEPHPTPRTNTPSTNPSATVNAPETQNNNTEEGTGDNSNQPSSVFILVDGEEYSDDEPGVYCYESEGLYSIGSDEDDQGRSFPQGNADAPVKEVRLELEMEFETLQQFKKSVRKFNINLGRSIFFPRIDSTRCKAICYDENCQWLTGLPCRHVCAAIAYQNRRAEDFAHNWLTMGAYNLAYQWTIQPVPSQEYWEKGNHYPLLPPVYRKPIGRHTKKRDSRRDGPRENPDPHRAKRRYGPIKYKYFLKV